MRLHTNLGQNGVYGALLAAKAAGKVTNDVDFEVFNVHRSQSHVRAFEIQLGTYDKHSLPAGTVDQHGKRMNVRRYKNSGQTGADSIWSATYFEWGWFMLEIFKLDPTATWGGKSWGYKGVSDFHVKTHYVFLTEMHPL